MINKTELNRLRAHIERNKGYLDNLDLNDNDDLKYTKSLSMSVLMDYFGLNQEKAFEALTEGSDDNKMDAFYFSDDEDELSTLTIIQTKYKRIDGDTPTFTADEIKLVIENCKTFLQGGDFQVSNAILLKKIIDYRKLLSDNGSPPISIKLFFVTNGIIHSGHKELNEIQNASNENIYPFFVDATKYGEKPQQKDGELDILVKDEADKTDSVFQVDDELYKGRVVSCTIKSLMNFYQDTGERLLLNDNVRYTIKNSKINKEIESSFKDDPKRFTYLNNGITIVCDAFQIAPTGLEINKLTLTKPSIVNGGQTVTTLYHIYKTEYEGFEENFIDAKILLRVYQAPSEYTLKIAKATNSQNPINIVDLHANDKSQIIAKEYFEKFGVGLLIKIGEDITFYDDTITNEGTLQIYASLYADDPAMAKRSKRTVFNNYYSVVFNENMNEQVCKKLERCYRIYKHVIGEASIDKALRSNGLYSIIYIMKHKNENVTNENIPIDQIEDHFKKALKKSIPIIEKIIEKKRKELGVKFSLNNLFKSNTIKDLIDIELGI